MAKDHIVMFPFMAKGHTIPLLHLATALSTRFHLHVTIITTPANAPFIRTSLRHPNIHLLLLPFPHLPPLPSHCESTDTLPSFHLFPLFLAATSLLNHPFDAALTHLLHSSSPLCLISDFFFGWTLPICHRLNIPRIVFHGMSAFSMTLCKSLWVHLQELDLDSGMPFHVPGTPSSLLLTKSDVPDNVLRSATDPNDPGTRFVSELGESDVNSWGVLVNSFADVEGEYVGLFERFYKNGARAWLVGPLCLFSDSSEGEELDECMRWLDEQEVGSVVYVAFGTQAEVAEEELDEVAHGLAESGCRFLWSVRSTWTSAPVNSTKYGKMVRWAPQTAVLKHRATGGFMSHCGWNSVLEAVSAGVPILAWPMIAEQHLNAKLVVEELGLGVRVLKGRIRREEVRGGVRELMGGGEKGRRARERAAELGEKAKVAVEGGGSSCRSLEGLVDELRKCRRERESEEVSSGNSVDGVQEVEFINCEGLIQIV